MTDYRKHRFHSKAFRAGNFKRMLDFAVRGLPRHVLRGEQYVDCDWAFRIYEREIRQLDEFNIHPKWFSSGVLGAALISLALYPGTLELWRRLARNEVFRDERGSDAPGLLRELIERHQNDRRLTRNHHYQLFLFQASLALASAWVHHADPDRRYSHLPPIPDAAAMIAEVRQLRGERHSKTGFRPPEVTRNRWIELSPPEIIHEPDFRKVLALAKRASDLEGTPPDDSALKNALDWVVKPHPPIELAHPAALAAATASIARNPNCRGLWDRVFGFVGCRKPNQGRKPLSDLSACMLDCIALANRSDSPDRAATALHFRAQVLVNLWLEQPDQFRMALPRAPRERPLDTLWADLEVNFRPRIIFADDAMLLAPPSGQNGTDGEEGGGAASNRKKPSPDAARKRLDTGKKAEKWFLQHYQSVSAHFRGVPLVDCREHQSGYDFKLKPDHGRWYVETKAVAEDSGAISLTDRQWKCARLEGDNYWLVTIRGIGGLRPKPLVVRNPAAYLEPRRQEVLVRRVEWHLNLGDVEAASGRRV